MKSIRANKVIIYLTTSDIFTWGLLISVNALIGIYLAEKLEVSNITEVVGVGIGLSSLARAIFQIPTGLLIDRIKSDRDDILVLATGNLLMGLPLLFFPLIANVYLFWVLQFLIGTGSALNLVAWRKLFAKNVDDGKEGLQYGVYDTIMSIAIATFSILAGVIANIGDAYFEAVFFGIGLLIISSTLWVLSILSVQNRKTL